MSVLKYKNENGLYETIPFYKEETYPALVGEIRAYAGTSEPYGWLICDGRELSTTEYKDLYDVIGTKYGSSGSGKFKIPNLINKFPEGGSTADVGKSMSAGLPNITGGMKLSDQVMLYSNSSYHWNSTYSSGAMSTTETTGGNTTGVASNEAIRTDQNKADILNFDASKSNSIYGSSTTVQPEAVKILYIIKYKKEVMYDTDITSTIETNIRTDMNTTETSIRNDMNTMKDTILKTIYPVGSVYISMGKTNPSTLFGFGTWTQLATGKTLWNVGTNDSNLGKSIGGSLPNIWGKVVMHTGVSTGVWNKEGALTDTNTAKMDWGRQYGDQTCQQTTFNFKASNSNSVYSASAGSNVVRPDSIGVTMWQRTA